MNRGVSSTGLSSLRDGAADASPPKASIPDAVILAIATIMDAYIAKLLDKPFEASFLSYALAQEDDIRSAAVLAVDAYHGFTFEFSPWPNQHASEYDTLEELIAKAMETGTAKTAGLGAKHDSAARQGSPKTHPTQPNMKETG